MSVDNAGDDDRQELTRRHDDREDQRAEGLDRIVDEQLATRAARRDAGDVDQEQRVGDAECDGLRERAGGERRGDLRARRRRAGVRASARERRQRESARERERESERGQTEERVLREGIFMSSNSQRLIRGDTVVGG